MAKPMLVTTPAVLLLLDYWPLNRRQRTEVRGQKSADGLTWSKLIAEKIPLFALSIASSAVALALQVQSPSSVGQLPFAWRVENALVTSVTYIGQIFWPANLAVFYPHPDDRLPLWEVLLAVAILIAITLSAYASRRTRPYLLVGWLWYLIMLSPVIGVIEVGVTEPADRYT